MSFPGWAIRRPWPPGGLGRGDTAPSGIRAAGRPASGQKRRAPLPDLDEGSLRRHCGRQLVDRLISVRFSRVSGTWHLGAAVSGSWRPASGRGATGQPMPSRRARMTGPSASVGNAKKCGFPGKIRSECFSAQVRFSTISPLSCGSPPASGATCVMTAFCGSLRRLPKR